MGRTSRRASSDAGIQVIQLRLTRAAEMFELAQADLFSEYRNFLTGVDFCLSEMRGQWAARPVRLEIHLPPEEIDDSVAERLARTLHRYCDHRIRYNRRESSSQRFGGISALRIGAPICALGLALTIAATRLLASGSTAEALAEQLGWVFVWIGLWFPLDQLLFYPLSFGREARVLRVLAQASIVVSPYRPATAAAAGSGWV
jgi:hypothetical protein